MSAAALELKLEPSSPHNYAVVEETQWASDTDTDLYWTTEDLLEAEELAKSDSKVEVLTKILENFEQFENLDKLIEQSCPDDAFSNYCMEENMLPIFEGPLISVKSDLEEKFHGVPLAPIVPPNSTHNLLKEFETVFDAVNNGAFTPPQTPPYQQQHAATVLTSLEPMVGVVPNIIYAPNPTTLYPYTSPPVPEEKNLMQIEFAATPQTDVARELAAVDELVRTRVEILVPSSPSSSSNYGDCSSDDPEWSNDMTESYRSSTSKVSRKRSKPYSHNSDDKKNRKKEQNKNAATRYRLKKKAEVEEILTEEKQYQEKNAELNDKITDLQREIRYIKGLMRDLFRAKGLIQ